MCIMRRLIKYIIPIILLMLPNMAASRDCSQILQDGTLKSIKINSNQHLKTIAYSRLNTYVNKNLTRENSSGMDGALGDITFGLTSNKRQAKQIQAALSQEGFESYDFSNEIAIALLSGDEEITSTWLKCMNEQKGLIAWFKSYGPTDVILNVKFISPYARISSAKLKSDTVLAPGMKVIGSDSCIRKYNLQLKNELNQQDCLVHLHVPDFKRSYTININTDIGDISVHLPPRVTYKLLDIAYPSDSKALTFVGDYRTRNNDGDKEDFIARVTLPIDLAENNWFFNTETIDIDASVNSSGTPYKECSLPKKEDISVFRDEIRFPVTFSISRGRQTMTCTYKVYSRLMKFKEGPPP